MRLLRLTKGYHLSHNKWQTRKAKTIGQKEYVDAIRKKMIVFGMGPAGTGKTYLAMAMAITALKMSRWAVLS